MIQVRQTAESLLKHSGIQITRDGDILPFDTAVSSSLYNSEEEDDEQDELTEVILLLFLLNCVTKFIVFF